MPRGRCRPPQATMPLCSELMSRPKKATAGYRPERTTPGGPSRSGRGRQYCKLRWLLSPKPEFSKCIFELKMPTPVIDQRFTSTNSCHEPPLGTPPPYNTSIPQSPPRFSGAARGPRRTVGTAPPATTPAAGVDEREERRRLNCVRRAVSLELEERIRRRRQVQTAFQSDEKLPNLRIIPWWEPRAPLVRSRPYQRVEMPRLRLLKATVIYFRNRKRSISTR